ncbi:MAG: exosortase H [Thermodesulfobacteriota bacterium]|jgi:exosortase H (IPTLxxWG-CTERM-specific)
MGEASSIRSQEIKTPSYRKEAFYFFIKFLVLMGLLLFLELFNPVNQKVIIPFSGFLARGSVFLLKLIGTETKASSTLIVSQQFSADIKAGCTGIEPIIILIAAMFAFRASWKAKFCGAFLGMVILQGINLVRIVSLVYLGVNHPRYFSEAHTYIWQIVIIALSLFLWIVWAKGLKSYETGAS